MQHQWNWDHVQVFMTLHRSSTLAAAARVLGQDATTVGRRVHALEEALAGKLFVRTPLEWQLSELGQAVLPAAEAMEAAALGLERAVAGQSEGLAGRLRLACVSLHAEEVLMPLLRQFSQRHPGIDLELVTSASLADLSRREADMALRFERIGVGPGALGGREHLRAKRLCVLSTGLYASADYLERRGRPRTVSDLAGHDIVSRDERGADVPGYDWLMALERQHSPTIALRCNPIGATRAAVSAGFGIGALPLFITQRRPGLIRVLPDLTLGERALWLVVHRDLRKVARVMALWDFLSQVLHHDTHRPHAEGSRPSS